MGGWGQSGYPGCKTGTHSAQDALPSQGPLTQPHIHPDWDNVDAPVHLMCTCRERERKLENLEKTHGDMGRMADKIFFSHCYNLRTFDGTTLFEDLLHVSIISRIFPPFHSLHLLIICLFLLC